MSSTKGAETPERAKINVRNKVMLQQFFFTTLLRCRWETMQHFSENSLTKKRIEEAKSRLK